MATVFPCAKINLGLYVVSLRPDGYHNLETVFYPVPLCDKLTVDVSLLNHDEISLSGIPVEGDVNNNLVIRVVTLMRQHYTIPPLRIHLEKNIPSGAGLGGGSSDAAFMMCLLNDMFSLGLSATQMEELISPLGADCAFFIQCKPRLAEGIGNIFSDIDISLKDMYLVLVKPNDFVSTKEAYSMVKAAPPLINLRQTIEGDIQQWKHNLLNDFETSVLPTHPNILKIKEKLYELGATYAIMSGSGSSVFGLFQEPPIDIDHHFAEHFFYTSPL